MGDYVVRNSLYHMVRIRRQAKGYPWLGYIDVKGLLLYLILVQYMLSTSELSYTRVARCILFFV